MNAPQVNYLNIALMLGSCGLAFLVPFELILFSYAFLGPLHYLTEISWLHKRNYFTTGKNDFILLIFLGALIILSFYFKFLLSWFLTANDKGQIIVSAGLKNLVDTLDKLVPAFTFLAFGTGLILILVKRKISKWVLFGILIALTWLLKEDKTWLVPFAVFLPTLIHVFLFTGIFILVGALKSRSFSGLLSLLVFIGCAASFFWLEPEVTGYSVNERLRYNFNMSFISLNFTVFEVFLPAQVAELQTANQILSFIYESKAGLVLTRFMAFAYTYHYLNWFSKTSVIQWHLLPKKQLIGVGILWLASISLFFYDYKVGYVAIYLLSTLHVVLELPLNFQAMKQIAEHTKFFLKPKGRDFAPLKRLKL